ncbi:MAG: hypothetical protein R6X27_05210 [Candidatus Desulfacyla sp.]
MADPLATVIQRVVDGTDGNGPLSGVPVSDQFRPEKKGDGDVARNLNAAFLIGLSGPAHPLYSRACRYLHVLMEDRAWAGAALFFREGLRRIGDEVTSACRSDSHFVEVLEEARAWCSRPATDWDDEARRKIWPLFFPEGAECLGDPNEPIGRIRGKRRVKVTRLNPDPIRDPGRQILFLSNLLITIPHDAQDLHGLPYGRALIRELKQVVHEKQIYWYDHPVQIGVEDENNEATYGLRGLDRAIAFEKQRKNVRPDEQATCLLSVSVTHNGLHRIVRDYLKAVYAASDPFSHLKVYLFSEVDTGRILEEVLLPAAKRYLRDDDGDLLRRVFGVDGEYGRHYSFLKALPAYWQVLIDPGVKGSFKLDLDQVFDQEILVAETGQSALEHFLTPLWGAEGTDTDGRGIELGMMAGALVNEKDIGRGLFTPDVPMPDPIPRGEAVVFFSQLPQAVSTRAEMMARYGNGMPDGVRACLQRIHVTGGTCAALVGSIRRHRPFTPTSIGRAEDQAYILSSLFKDPDRNLRYLHKPGLIMRHDKETFAGQAIAGAGPGKYIGDLARTLLFSYYARALPWPLTEIKGVIDPFTGCFVCKIPFTVVYLRLGLKLLEVFARETPTGSAEGLKLLALAVDRIESLMRDLEAPQNPLMETFLEEKRGWNLFYDVLDCIEAGLERGDGAAALLRQKARGLVNDCLVQTGRQTP